ncbi:MAG: hypothetical protein SFW63_04620 [Alphaproteobacteria bacterium]|nr:hypothetical protein [Alphaproteobacteria bacterium]
MALIEGVAKLSKSDDNGQRWIVFEENTAMARLTNLFQTFARCQEDYIKQIASEVKVAIPTFAEGNYPIYFELLENKAIELAKVNLAVAKVSEHFLGQNIKPYLKDNFEAIHNFYKNPLGIEQLRDEASAQIQSFLVTNQASKHRSIDAKFTIDDKTAKQIRSEKKPIPFPGKSNRNVSAAEIDQTINDMILTYTDFFEVNRYLDAIDSNINSRFINAPRMKVGVSTHASRDRIADALIFSLESARIFYAPDQPSYMGDETRQLVNDALKEMAQAQEAYKQMVVDTRRIGKIQRRGERTLSRTQELLEKARSAVEREARERQEFLSTKQPYLLSPDAKRYHLQIRSAADSTAQHAEGCAQALQQIDSIIEGFDRRDPQAETLANLLFAPSTLAQCAEHLQVKLENNPHLVQMNNGLSVLRGLYGSGEYITGQIDQILESPIGALLIAEHCNSSAICKRFGEAFIKAISTINKEKLYLHQTGYFSFNETERAQLVVVDENIRKHVDILISAENAIQANHKIIKDAVMNLIRHRQPLSIDESQIHIPQQLASDVPEHWKPHLPDRWVAVSGGGRRGEFTIFDRDHPDLSVTLKPNLNSGELQKELTKLQQKILLRDTNLQTIQTMQRDNGFVLISTPEGLSLRHAAYQLGVQLGDDEGANAQYLERLKCEFEICAEQQRMLQDSIQSMGIDISAITCGERYWSKSMFDLIRGHIEQHIESVPMSTGITTLAQDRTASAERRPWQIDNNQTILIFDSSSLFNLAYDRSDKQGAWLDLVRCTSRLPNIIVAIPSEIADFELRGRIRSKDGWKEVCTRSKRNLFDELLGSAARIRLDEQGGITTLDAGRDDTHIVIVEDDQTQATFKHIAELRELHHNDHNFHNALRAHLITHNDLGDHAIDRLIANSKLAVPMHVITDDLTHAYQRMKRKNGAGLSVGFATTLAYVAAEFNAAQGDRAQIISTKLAKHGEGKPYNAHEVAEEIRNANAEWRLPLISQAGDGSSETIADVIQTGATTRMQERLKSGQRKAESGLRKQAVGGGRGI